MWTPPATKPFQPEPASRLIERKINLRELPKGADGKHPVKVPQIVQQFFVQLLNTTGKRSDYFETCITCENFDPETEHCKLFGKRPPARVIADGCSSYLDNELVPF